MKMRLFIFCTVIMCLAVPVFADTADDPNLVGWWNFNDATAKDSSQYGHHGVLAGGARVVYDAQMGMVLHNPYSGFNYPSGGHSGHVYCGGEKAPGDPNTWADISRSYTVLCWVKSQVWWWPPWPSVPNRFEKEWQAIFTKGGRANGQIFLGTVGTQGRINFRARLLLPTDQIYGNTFVDDGYWHHVAAVCDYDSVSGNTTLHLYIDGYEEYNSPVTCTGGSLSMSDAPVYIAGSYSTPTKDGEIYMDDVRLYNRALSLTEIEAVIDEPIPADLTGDSYVNLDDFRVLADGWGETDYTISSDTGGMVAHWDFNGTAGTTTVTDSVGGLTGTIVGGASLDGSGAVELSGGLNGPYIDLGEDVGDVIAGLDEYTVIIDCNWYGVLAGGEWQRLAAFSQEGTTEFAMFTLVDDNNDNMRWLYRHNGHDEITTASTLIQGRHQIAITFTRDYALYGCSQLYIDGVQKAFRTTFYQMVPPVPSGSIGSTIRNYIGKGPYEVDVNNPDIDNKFAGKIYDVRIYDRRMAAQDVNDVYQGLSRELYFPLEAPGNLSDDEPVNEKVVDFKDVAELVSKWLQEMPLLKE